MLFFGIIFELKMKEFRTKGCYQCLRIYNRTRNILQIRRSECDDVTDVRDICMTINEESEFDTLFRKLFISFVKGLILFV